MDLLAAIEARCLRLSHDFPAPAAAPSAPAMAAGTAAMIEWLGEGIAESVHWRRGALQYYLVRDHPSLIDGSSLITHH